MLRLPRALLLVAFVAVLVGALGAASVAAELPAGPAAGALVSFDPLRPDLKGRELAELRTRTSRTYELPDGRRVAAIFARPVNYRAADGSWQPIDSTLVAASGGFDNRAGDVRVHVPSDLSQPVQVTSGSASLAFTLQGASGPVVASGETATFASPLPGVTVRYDSLPNGLKESTLLASAAAPASFTYTVAVSAGVSAQAGADGSVVFRSADGTPAFVMPAPSMTDAAGASSPAVAVTLAPAAGGYTLTLSADPKWLADPARKFPVAIDPTSISYGTATNDCTITSGDDAGTSYCTAQNLQIGMDASDQNEVSRTIVQFDTSDPIPAHAQIENAEFDLYLTGSSTSNTATVNLYPLNRTFTNNATWNSYDTGQAWTSAGGDYDGSQAYPDGQGPMPVSGRVPGYYSWFPTQLVQSWLDSGRTMFGFLLKQANENVNDVLSFTSSETSPWNGNPALYIDYQVRFGEQPTLTYDRGQLGDPLDYGVDVAGGNLLVHEHAMTLPGVAGTNFAFDWYWNSENPIASCFGNSASTTTTASIRLIENDGSLIYQDQSGYEVPFIAATPLGSSFISPPGIDATMQKNVDGANTYTLTWNKSGLKYIFAVGGNGAALNTIKDAEGNTISKHWVGNCPDTITDTLGHVTSFTTNASSLTTQMTDPAGSDAGGPRHYGFAYDTNGNMTTYTDPAGKQTVFTYDTNWNITKITSPAGKIVTFSYTDPSDPYKLTSLTRVTNTQTLTGPSTSYVYTDNPTSGSCAGSAGQTVATDKDASGTTTGTTTYCWNAEYVVTNTIDSANQSSGETLNAAGYPAATTNAAGGVTTYSYDSNNNVTQVQAPQTQTGVTPATDTYTYTDTANPHQVTSHTDPMGHRWNYAYDSHGNLCAKTEGTPITTVTCNARSDPNQGANPVTFTYNSDGTLAAATDAKGNTTSYSYDASTHALTKVTPPAPLQPATFTYDSVGRVKTVTDGSGVTATYSYDALDRVTNIAYSDSQSDTVSFTYYDDGLVHTRTDGTSTTTYTYDAQDELTSEAKQGVTITYGYDSHGNLTSVGGEDPAGSVTYGYDSADRLTSIQEPNWSGHPFTISYPSATETLATYPNGVTVDETYDKALRVTGLHDKYANGTDIANRSYSYTYTSGGQTIDAGVETSATDVLNNYTESYGYDSVDRLVDANKTQNGTTSERYQYSYDANGNKTQDVTFRSGSTTTVNYLFNNANELCWSGNGTPPGACPTSSPPYSYDSNGNELTSPAITPFGSVTFPALTLQYNARQQPAAATPAGSPTVSHAYLGPDQWERNQSSASDTGSETFLNDGLGIASRSAGGATTYYTRSPDGTVIAQRTTSSNTGNYYYLTDERGNVIYMIDSTGNTKAGSYSYTPYGAPTATTGTTANPWRYGDQYYDGAYHDGDHLYKIGERYYDPAIGRWTQRDPIDDPARPCGASAYSYADDDPIDATDPSGLQPSCQNYRKQGNWGFIAVQMNARGTIQIGAYRSGYASAPGLWIYESWSNGKPTRGFKTWIFPHPKIQTYPPHWVITRREAPSGSVVTIAVAYVGSAGPAWGRLVCVVP